MDEIKALIESPTFWVASVITALFMNLVAGYIKDFIDKCFKERSRKRDQRAKENVKNFNKKVEKLKTHPYFLSLYQSNIVYQKIRQVLYYTISYFCLLLSLYAVLVGHDDAAIVLFITGIAIKFTAIKSVTLILDELCSVVNAALDDDDTHFIG